MLRCVSPLARRLRGGRSYQQVTVRRGAELSLVTRIGLVTASNDHRVQRLTGSLPLVQKSLAGDVIVYFFLIVFGFSFSLQPPG
jgi:hypothetical protein